MIETAEQRHGGTRKGAGRKPLADGVKKSFRLQPRHVQFIDQWSVTHHCKSPSEALRAILDYLGYGAISR